MSYYQLKPIGKVRNDDSGAFIELEPEYISGLQALEGFSHINVMWWFSECDNQADRNTFIDAIDGTSVLDIKPYTPSFDRVETPGIPVWFSEWPRSTEESGSFNWEQVFNI